MTSQMAQKKVKIKKKVEALHIPPHLVDEYWMLVEFMLREGLKFEAAHGRSLSAVRAARAFKKGEEGRKKSTILL